MEDAAWFVGGFLLPTFLHLVKQQWPVVGSSISPLSAKNGGESVASNAGPAAAGGGLAALVVGCGGVGSWVAKLLAADDRVSHLTLIDFDQVTLSSLNRHSCATHDDVGLPKCAVLRQHLLLQRRGAGLSVDILVSMFNEDNADDILMGQSSRFGDRLVVFDCIDHAETKALLMRRSSELGLAVYAVMGTGARLDPAQLCCGVLQELPGNDPLLKKMRYLVTGAGQRRLRERAKQRSSSLPGPPTTDRSSIHVVSSIVKPDVGLMPFHEQIPSVEDASEFAVLPSFRVRILPVYSAVPCMAAALAVISALNMGQGGFRPLPDRLTHTKAAQMSRSLHQRWAEVFGTSSSSSSSSSNSSGGGGGVDGGGYSVQSRPVLSEDDVRAIVEDHFDHRSVLSGQLAVTMALARLDDLLRHSPTPSDLPPRQQLEAAAFRVPFNRGATHDSVVLLTDAEYRHHIQTPTKQNTKKKK